ncbi:MAG: YqaJ viral recombinase family protein [Actinomycetota bacterium]
MTAVVPVEETVRWYPNADVVLNLEFADEHERLTVRTTGIGSSDINIILGDSRWQTPLELWEVKTGRTPIDTTTSEAAEWGQALEPVIARKFSQRHDCRIVNLPFVLARRDKPWHRASPDSGVEFYARPTLVEIKCRDQYGWDSIDPAVYDQVQWQLHVTGLDDAYIVVLFRGREMPPPWPVRRDQERIDYLIEKVDEFWGYVQLDEPPPPMPTDTRRLTPADGQKVADNDILAKVTVLDEWKELADAAKAVADEAADELRLSLVDHDELVDADGNRLYTYRMSEKTGRRTLRKVARR